MATIPLVPKLASLMLVQQCLQKGCMPLAISVSLKMSASSMTWPSALWYLANSNLLSCACSGAEANTAVCVSTTPVQSTLKHVCITNFTVRLWCPNIRSSHLALDEDEAVDKYFPCFFLMQIVVHNQSDSLCGENTFIINEALVRMSLKSLNRSNPSVVYQDGVYGINISNSAITRTSENQVNLKMDISCQSAVTNELWKSTSSYQQIPSSCKINKDAFNNGN